MIHYARQIVDREAATTLDVVEAALDQPNPTPALVAALQSLLVLLDHPDRLQ